MPYINRNNRIKILFPEIQKFRLKQIETAFFDPSIRSWNQISTLPIAMREILNKEVPFVSLSPKKILESKKDETYKAIVEIEGEKFIETVLMKNRKEQWSICVSTQVGCAMACAFCATGKMGLTRNLDADEIVDQVRLWQQFLHDSSLPPSSPLGQGGNTYTRISNIVYMGMGEPLANYENVKSSLNTILAQTDIGKTHITVSTVGVLPRLEQILTDVDWPHVRLAISLHSADAKTRKEIVKSSYDEFLPTLDDWSRRYLKKFGNRRHHLTFEYVMLKGINDSVVAAKQLAVFVNRIGKIRVNLIPFNFTESGFVSSDNQTIQTFGEVLEKNGVTYTIRYSKGSEIDAACGQLIKNESASLQIK